MRRTGDDYYARKRKVNKSWDARLVSLGGSLTSEATSISLQSKENKVQRERVTCLGRRLREHSFGDQRSGFKTIVMCKGCELQKLKETGA